MHFLFVLFVLVRDLGEAVSSALGQPAAIVSGVAIATVALLALRARPLFGAPADAAAPCDPEPTTRFRRGAALLMLASFSANIWFLAWPLAHAGRPQLWVLGLGVALFAFALARPPRSVTLVGLAVAIGIALRLASLTAVPIDPMRADMLPVVRGAVENLLAHRDPYALYRFPTWTVPLAYLPGTWLAYLPAVALHFDLRLINLALELGLGAILLALGRDRRIWLLWAWTFTGASAIEWSLLSEHAVLWLLLGVVLFFVYTRRPGRTAIALGVCAGSSPLVAVVAPFIGLYWLKTESPRKVAGLIALALAIAAAMLLPFYFWNRETFILGAFRWHNDPSLFGLEKWNGSRTWATQIGFAGLFWRAARVRWLKPIQALLVGAILVRYLRRGARLAELAPHAIVALTLFMVFNPINWGYLYWPAGVLWMVHLAARDRIAESPQ